MWIIYDIRRIVKYIYQVFADMALWCWAHDPPFGWFGSKFAIIYDHLTDLHYGLYLFAEDYESLWEGILGIITESDVFSLLQTWLTYAEDAWYWVSNAFGNVLDIIWEWWPIALNYVISYVDAAVEGLDSLIATWDQFWTVTWPQWMSLFEGFKADWDNFWTTIFPDLVSFTWLTTWWNSRVLEVQDLISTAVEGIEDLMMGWQEVRDKVIEFFNDPLEWLWTRFTDWFLGPEG